MFRAVMVKIMFPTLMLKLKNQVQNVLQAVADAVKRTKPMTATPMMMVRMAQMTTALLVKLILMIPLVLQQQQLHQWFK